MTTAHATTGTVAHLALRVGGQWVAVTAPIQQAAAAGTGPATWRRWQISLPTSGAGWADISLTPPPAATVITLGSARATVPAGAVTGVGVYFPGFTSGQVARIKDVKVR